jgi:Fur family transcriptional regulator, ferric uptake regulator
VNAPELDASSEHRARPTRQRRAISAALGASDEFRSAQDIHEVLRRDGEKIGLATVYRSLQLLAETGQVDVVKTASGEAVYRQCSPSHHHHLVCRVCGRTIEIQGPAVERWANAMAAENGYTEVSHTIELFGTCPDCAHAAGD